MSVFPSAAMGIGLLGNMGTVGLAGIGGLVGLAGLAGLLSTDYFDLEIAKELAENPNYEYLPIYKYVSEESQKGYGGSKKEKYLHEGYYGSEESIFDKYIYKFLPKWNTHPAPQKGYRYSNEYSIGPKYKPKPSSKEYFEYNYSGEYKSSSYEPPAIYKYVPFDESEEEEEKSSERYQRQVKKPRNRQRPRPTQRPQPRPTQRPQARPTRQRYERDPKPEDRPNYYTRTRDNDERENRFVNRPEYERKPRHETRPPSSDLLKPENKPRDVDRPRHRPKSRKRPTYRILKESSEEDPIVLPRKESSERNLIYLRKKESSETSNRVKTKPILEREPSRERGREVRTKPVLESKEYKRQEELYTRPNEKFNPVSSHQIEPKYITENREESTKMSAFIMTDLPSIEEEEEESDQIMRGFIVSERYSFPSLEIESEGRPQEYIIDNDRYVEVNHDEMYFSGGSRSHDSYEIYYDYE